MKENTVFGPVSAEYRIGAGRQALRQLHERREIGPDRRGQRVIARIAKERELVSPDRAAPHSFDERKNCTGGRQVRLFLVSSHQTATLPQSWPVHVSQPDSQQYRQSESGPTAIDFRELTSSKYYSDVSERCEG